MSLSNAGPWWDALSGLPLCRPRAIMPQLLINTSTTSLFSVSSRSTSLVQPVQTASLNSHSWFCHVLGREHLRSGWEEFTAALSSVGLWRICQLANCLHGVFCAAFRELSVVCGQGWRQRNGSASVIATSVGREIAVWGTVKKKGRAHFFSLKRHPFLPSPCNYLLQAVFPLDYLQSSSTKSIEKQANTEAVKGLRNFCLMSWCVPSHEIHRGAYQTMSLLWVRRQDFSKSFPFSRQGVQEAPGFGVY